MKIYPILFALLATSAVSCTEFVRIEVIRSTVNLDMDRLEIQFKPEMEYDINKFGDDAVARLYICGHSGKYEDRSDINRIESSDIYFSDFPASLQERVYFEPSGKVSRGWPTNLTREAGVCFRVGAGDMTGRHFESQEIQIYIENVR